jgi:LacI family transcriptional regulator
MINQSTKIVLAAPTFGSAIQIAMLENLKKLVGTGEIAMRSVTDDPDTQRDRLKQALIQTKPTALIAMDIRLDSETVAEYYASNVPIVLFDEEAVGVSTIMTDNITGGRIAGEYLISKGRKKIAIVTGRIYVKGGFNAEQRFKGFDQALRAKGLSIPQGCAIEVPHYSREDGLAVMPKLIELGVDAIFCAAGDNCALGLLTIANDRGVKIPDKIAVVGFDDLLIARLSTPTLTTIRQPLAEMAAMAHKMAVINRNEILQKPQRVLFKPELVVRQSA